ncbi:hypothetical protein L1987_53592 [Smallanthus sonchifolius]|uniref:Uncharacterized protein n=1 Tax=Smallanthus sonchifolius TaxID=185202 RepID=A0ACB9EWC6_9ASTR|nr:hypothetical protein L1987_53592 [Smallanthus sonchifolius]
MSTIAKEIESTMELNPGIPIKVLQDLIQKKYQVHISLKKIFRAKVLATKKVQSDFTTQYLLLRDYCAELLRSNRDTTVTIEVEREFNPTTESRQFKRIYICYGCLKVGFKQRGGEVLGLDGCFMKGPFPRQILTAVGVYGNNGIYPVAFAIVEAESSSSWTWFLQCLGNDLDLNIRSNFTFLSDRKKGIIPAIKKVYPSIEHRYCPRHIHENMKIKWRSNMFKNMLWKAGGQSVMDYSTMYDMAANGIEGGIPESWVDEVYWLSTWKKVNENTIDPINGKEMWTPSACPTSLLPPEHHTQIGRPKKARKKSVEELSQKINTGGKMTRKGKAVTCQVCKQKGHNKRGCKERGPSTSTQPTSQQQ